MMKNLKISTLSIFLFSFALFANSQETINDLFSEKNEISIVVDNVFAKNADYYPILFTDNQGFIIPIPFDYLNDQKQTTIGLSYKRHFNKSALRTKISFGSSSYKKNDGQPNLYSQNNKKLFVSYSLGYERNIDLTRVRFFYGFDLFINYKKIEIEDDHFNAGAGSEFHRETSLKSRGFGISPLIGARVYVTKSISFSTELKFVIETYKGQNLSSSTGYYNDSREDSIDGTNFGFGPLGQISLNIHF
jgi:hypothetical protein